MIKNDITTCIRNQQLKICYNTNFDNRITIKTVICFFKQKFNIYETLQDEKYNRIVSIFATRHYCNDEFYKNNNILQEIAQKNEYNMFPRNCNINAYKYLSDNAIEIWKSFYKEYVKYYGI